MFGALNRIIGRLDSETPQEPHPAGESTSFGFQVLRNKNTELPLEPWFDFVVGLNGHPIVSRMEYDRAIILVDTNCDTYRKTQTRISLLQKSATAPVPV